MEEYQPGTNSIEDRFKKLGVRISENADNVDLNAELNLAGLEELRPAAVRTLERAIERSRDYLTAPTIRDSFGSNHEQRREWRNALPDDLRLVYNRNKLRLNSIGGVVAILELVVSQLDAQDIHTSEAERLRGLQKQVPLDIVRYDSLTEDEKEVVTQKIDSICREFLSLVTRPKAT